MSEWCMLEVSKAKSIQGCIRRSLATQTRELSPPLPQRCSSHIWTSVTAHVATHSGGTRKNYKSARGDLPGWVLGFCGETEGLEPGESEAEGDKVVDCNSLRGGFRDAEAFLCSGKRRKFPQCAD